MQASLFNRALVRVLPRVPKSVVWQFSRRYIAGPTLDDAVRAIKELNARGARATVDVLGEDIEQPVEAEQGRDLYLKVLDGIVENRLDCSVSVKLTELGLRLDTELCRRLAWEIATASGRHQNFMRIDMEDSSVTDATLDIYRELRMSHPATGVAIQSYLRRSGEDVRSLLETCATDIRLCKGIYVEPPEIAFQDDEEIRDSFRSLLELLFNGGATRVGIATHDTALIQHALGLIKRMSIPKDLYEFQMLLGVTEKLRTELIDDGHPLRVYVPFGQAWFTYSVRRLKENPKLAGHIVNNLFRA